LGPGKSGRCSEVVAIQRVKRPKFICLIKKFIENDLIFIKKLILLLNWFFFFICISSVVLLINFDFIVSLWIGDDFLSIADYNVIINSFFFMLLIVWNNIYSTILSGISKINLGIYVTLFSSLVNIPLSIYLSKNTHFGLSGIILASNLLLIITSIISPIQVYYFIFSKTKKPFLDKLLS
jgi:O-antigen/teichoic acid export membrane protein